MNIIVKFFDFIKRLNMDKLYRGENPWGREDYTGDIDAAISLISERGYKKCLDAGTGLGHYAERAASFCENVLAIDISPLAIERARKRLASVPNITFKTANLRDFDTKEGFDLVILGDMLYYLGDVRFPNEFKALIKHISSLVANGGGRILMSNFISTNRPKSVFSRYIQEFLSNGFIAEKQKTFQYGKRCWIQTVLKKGD